MIHAYVWSAFNPWTPIYDALNIYFTTEMENIELYTVFRDEGKHSQWRSQNAEKRYAH